MTTSIFTASTLDDLFAAPHVHLGFRPRESVCVIALSGRRMCFQVRVDLPEDPAHLPGIADYVADHVRAQDADTALVLAYSCEPERAQAAAIAVAAACDPLPCPVVAWTDDRRAWSTDPDVPDEGAPLSPVDSHPLLAQAVFAGQEVLEDREQMEQTWAPYVDDRAVTDEQVDEAAWYAARDLASWPATEIDARAVEEIVAMVESDQRAPDHGTSVRVALWMSRPGVRDELWQRLRVDSADHWLAPLRHVARSVPAPHSAVPYAMAGYAYYLLGKGAQASCAFERSTRAWPQFRMAQTLHSALMAGVRPREVERMVVACCSGVSPSDENGAREPRTS